jgi:hypothetical protein
LKVERREKVGILRGVGKERRDQGGTLGILKVERRKQGGILKVWEGKGGTRMRY